jgi:hypothetical protein
LVKSIIGNYSSRLGDLNLPLGSLATIFEEEKSCTQQTVPNTGKLKQKIISVLKEAIPSNSRFNITEKKVKLSVK